MSHLKFTNGVTITWPSLGLFRTWLLMFVLSPFMSAPFLWCWAGVTLVRVVFQAVKK